MSRDIVIKKGANIKLKGQAQLTFAENLANSSLYAIRPDDLHGITPKMIVKEGATVKAGEAIFYVKADERIRIASPVSGVVKEIVRGAKRKIMEVRIEADGNQDFATSKQDESSREAIIESMLEAGLWPLVKKRPYDVIANPDQTPKSIFISGFDAAPLGVDIEFALNGRDQAFQKGIDVLAKLTEGAIHLNVDGSQANSFFSKVKNVTLNNIKGKYPASTVGTQIHHIDPINKGEVVWTVSPQDVAIIGEYFASGQYKPTRRVAIAGPRVNKPEYTDITAGQNIANVITAKATEEHVRVISGGVFTGTAIERDSYLGYYDQQIVILEEGDKHVFFGWLPFARPKVLSLHGTSLSVLSSGEFDINTNLQGEHRPFVVTGKYEKYIPMEILPLQLFKAILEENIEKMEAMGIYEIAPEDVALAEFSCPSKSDLMAIVRDGLDLMIRETE